MESFVRLFPLKYQELFEGLREERYCFTEIRFRAGKPLIFVHSRGEIYVTAQGKLTEDIRESIKVETGMLRSILDYLCQHSLYAFKEELCNGFFTVNGGHRVGIAGSVALGEDGRIIGMKYISYMNIRIAKEIPGIACKLLPKIYCRGELMNTLIASPPGYGKTTLLRDVICKISDGNPYGKPMNVSVVDERGELSGSAQGSPCLNLGERTDVMYGCSKAKGMMMLLRSMGPQVIAVDELGGESEATMVMEMANCGVKILSTIHAGSMDELNRKRGMEELFGGIFQRIVFLKKENEKYGVGMVYEYNYEKGEFMLCKE